MVFANQIIKRSFDLCGASDLWSNDINANEFDPIFVKLQDLIQSMNNDPQIIFGYNTLEGINLGGFNSIYFKPLTQDEIDTSATNFDANRLFYEIPSTPPTLIYDGDELTQVIHSQVMMLRSQGSTPSVFSFSREYDRAVLAFDGNPTSPLTIVYPKSIELPAQPSDELKIPGQFINFFIAALALEICVVHGMKETIGLISDKMKTERDKVKSNNQLNRQEVLLDPRADRFENRGFRKWSV